MDIDVKVEPVDHYSLHLFNCHGKLIATETQVDGIFVLDRVLDRASESTDYTDIDNDSCLLELKTTWHSSRHNSEKLIVWHIRSAHVNRKELKILSKITDASMMTGMCTCEPCIKFTLAGKPFRPTTSGATEPMLLVHSDICGPLETAIRGGRYMVLFIGDTMRHTDD